MGKVWSACLPRQSRNKQTVTCYATEVWDYLTWDSGTDKNLLVQKSKGQSRRDVKPICLAQEDLGQSVAVEMISWGGMTCVPYSYAFIETSHLATIRDGLVTWWIFPSGPNWLLNMRKSTFKIDLKQQFRVIWPFVLRLFWSNLFFTCYLQDLLKTQLFTLLPQKMEEMLHIMERDSLLKTIGFSHYGIISASIVDSPWNGHVEPYFCQMYLFQCWTGYALKWWKKIPQNLFKKWELQKNWTWFTEKSLQLVI